MADSDDLKARLMKIRQDLGQVSWFLRRYSDPKRWRRQARAIRAMHLPPVPHKRRQIGEVWGVTVVRDEADVLFDVIDHMFEQGVDQLLIADNRSSDGTRERLQALARQNPRVHVALDEEPAHVQSEKMTWLAHQAWRSGADWIVAFDADEFWFARDMSVADFLRQQDVGIVHAAFHHMVPTVPAPFPLREAEFIIDGSPSHPGKVALRSHPFAEIIPGNHGAARVGGEGRGLYIAHAQYRSPKQVARKVRQGSASAKLTGQDLSWFSPHWVSGASLSDEDIQVVWQNISAGRPDERLQYRATGPMVTCTPLLWRTWDPDGLLSP